MTVKRKKLECQSWLAYSRSQPESKIAAIKEEATVFEKGRPTFRLASRRNEFGRKESRKDSKQREFEFKLRDSNMVSVSSAPNSSDQIRTDLQSVPI